MGRKGGSRKNEYRNTGMEVVGQGSEEKWEEK